MKKSYFILLLSLYCLPLCSQSQVVTFEDLVTLTTLSDKRLSSYMSKMSFAAVGRSMEDGTVISEYFYRNKKQPFDTTLRVLAGYKKEKITGVTYLTSSFTEYYSILRGFQVNGFIVGGKPGAVNPKADSIQSAPRADSTMAFDSVATEISIDSTATIDSNTFYQKGELTLRVGGEMRDEVRVFRMIVERRAVPSSSSVRYAEDLLNFDSHQALIAMFGQNNVKKDIYFFTELDTARCSVIFPKSNRQAIFLWDDQESLRTLSFLIIGGSLHAGTDPDEEQSVALNAWRSSSGMYTGMRISEILRINENDFNVYGNQSEFAMMAVPEKKGNIDFKSTGAVFGCLNCSGNPTMRKEKVSAQGTVDAGLQLYITSLVLMPFR